METVFYSGIGQDSHRFLAPSVKGNLKADWHAKVLVLGGVVFEGETPLDANSDGDVVLHALTNAISGVTCKNVLGKRADELCRAGNRDSRSYLRLALQDAAEQNLKVVHASFSIECMKPKITPNIEKMRASIGELLNIAPSYVGITATTGELLSECGRGVGIYVTCVVTMKGEC